MAWGLKITTADKWFSKAKRLSHDYICERCSLQGGPTSEDYQTQNCHIISRAKNSVRYAVGNTLCLCVSCHIETGNNKKEHKLWIIEKYGQARIDQIDLTAKGKIDASPFNLKIISDHYRNEFNRMTKTGDRDLETWN